MAGPFEVNNSNDSRQFQLGLKPSETASDKFLQNDQKMQADKMSSNNWFNLGNGMANIINDSVGKWLGYELMKDAMANQLTIVNKDFELKTKLVDVQDHLIGSQEKVAIQQMKTTERVAELTKERDIALGKTRADAAVKIAKVNALNSQFYGQPNQLPSWTA